LLQIRFAVVERLLGKGTTPKIVKNRNKWKFIEFLIKKTDLRDFGGIYVFFYDFGTVPYQNPKKIVNFSSFWLKTRFWEPWWHLRSVYVFFKRFCFKSGCGGGKRILGKGAPTKIDRNQKSYPKP
jgi:hypothetical protein